MKRILTFFALLLASLLTTALVAQQPPVNISAEHHPKLHAAQVEIRNAWVKVDEAQHANDWDMQGHAAKARELLFSAGEQLKSAAEAANANVGQKHHFNGEGGPEPVINVSADHHPKLHAAQVQIREAWLKILDAQSANEWDMDGHAQKAKDLIFQAAEEIKAAALAANHH